MFAGEYHLTVGRSAEKWGRAGVLKYPHGAALHALQILPVLNWGLTRLCVRNRTVLLKWVVWAQFVFLFHAIWQTFHGRSRLDVDVAGLTLLLFSIVLFLIPVVFMLHALSRRGNRISRRVSYKPLSKFRRSQSPFFNPLS